MFDNIGNVLCLTCRRPMNVVRKDDARGFALAKFHCYRCDRTREFLRPFKSIAV